MVVPIWPFANTAYSITGTLNWLINRTNKQKMNDIFKSVMAYPNNTNSSTTATMKIDLFLGYQIHKDQLVPSNIQYSSIA